METGPFGFLQANDGIRLRYGFWPGKGGAHRSAILVLGGRTEFMEKYLETIREINSRGFDAFSLDWRGQGLSDRMLADRTRGYVRSFADYLSDLRLIIDKVVRPNCHGPLIGMAHSMGATIMLPYLYDNPAGLDRAILLSPMLDIRTRPIPGAMIRWYCGRRINLGMADRNIAILKRGHSFSGSFTRNRVTHDQARFYQVRRLLEKNPQLMVIGVTWGWLAASFEATQRLMSPGFARRITTPLLVVTAGKDRVVRNAATLRFAAQLPVHETACVHGAYHEMLQERDDLRNQVWKAFDRFVRF